MAWQQLHLQCEKANVDLAEALLLEAGALSIALDDAGDHLYLSPYLVNHRYGMRLS